MYVPNGMAPGQCQQDREVGYVDGVKDVSGDTASVASRLLLIGEGSSAMAPLTTYVSRD